MVEPIDMPRVWSLVRRRLACEVGKTSSSPELLSAPSSSRATWAVQMPGVGELVVKASRGERTAEKTSWGVANLPRLAERGYPLPVILWHGALDEEWYVVVQRRLVGRPLRLLTAPLLDQLIALVELQADADAVVAGEDRDFGGYIANVLFDDWDQVWSDAVAAGPGACGLCARLKAWLSPVWGLRVPARDFTHNDLNLANVLCNGDCVTGVVDWDEFGLGCRAIDLVVPAFDCEALGEHEMSDRLLAHALQIAGDDALRCLVSYRAIAILAHNLREGKDSQGFISTAAGLLDRLRAPRADRGWHFACRQRR